MNRLKWLKYAELKQVYLFHQSNTSFSDHMTNMSWPCWCNRVITLLITKNKASQLIWGHQSTTKQRKVHIYEICLIFLLRVHLRLSSRTTDFQSDSISTPRASFFAHAREGSWKRAGYLSNPVSFGFRVLGRGRWKRREHEGRCGRSALTIHRGVETGRVDALLSAPDEDPEFCTCPV